MNFREEGDRAELQGLGRAGQRKEPAANTGLQEEAWARPSRSGGSWLGASEGGGRAGKAGAGEGPGASSR